MQIAIITDIHGNLAGLNAVLRDVDERRCGRVLCLGDLVDGGDHNNEVVRLIRDRGIPCDRGNHDDNSDLDLAIDVRAFLGVLPEQIEDHGLLYTHISPRMAQRKIIDVYEAWNVFEDCLARRIVVGHAHIPMIFRERSDHTASASEVTFAYNDPCYLEPADRFIICVGAVGYPRDGIRYPRYAIFDDESSTVEMRIVDGPTLPFG